MVEALGRYLLKMVSEGSFQGLSPSSSNIVCSHQQFIDDTILLGISSIREAITLKNTLNLYSKASGQFLIGIKVPFSFSTLLRLGREGLQTFLAVILALFLLLILAFPSI